MKEEEMDKLSIFSKEQGEITLSSENSLDNVVDDLTKILNELKLTRAGNEAFVYGEGVEESDEIDLDELNLEEVE